jgi:hypothetical protein
LTKDERELFSACKSHNYSDDTTVYVPINSSHEFRVEIDKLLRNKNMLPHWININPYACNVPSIVYLYNENYDDVLSSTTMQQREDVDAAINA